MSKGDQSINAFKAMDDDPVETRDKQSTSVGSKRPSSDMAKDHIQEAAKRTKLDDELKKSIKINLRHLPRKEVEDLVAEKIVEMLSSRSELGELRRRCDVYKEKDEKWKQKFQALLKMCQNLNTVMRRYIADAQKNKEVAPIKITRSVGIQVDVINRRKLTSAQQIQIVSTNQTEAPKTNAQTPMANVVTVSHQDQVQAPVWQRVSPIPPSLLPQIPIPFKDLPTAGSRPPPITIPVAQRVFDVDLVDDDDAQNISTLALSQNPVIIPSNQVQTVPPNNQTVTSRTLVNNSTTTMMVPPIRNKLVHSRPQPPALETTNGLGPSIVRAPQIVPNPQMSTNVWVRQLHGQRAFVQIFPRAHPAPLPDLSSAQCPDLKRLPPKPKLKIKAVANVGIVLSWNLNLNLTEHADIAFYQIFGYQETGLAPNVNLWNKIGDVKSLDLPMACTLTHFTKGNRYHFAVRAEDVHSRVGPFSPPQSISL